MQTFVRVEHWGASPDHSRFNQKMGNDGAIFRAGHAFAHSAFARIALVNESQLDELEKAAIADLQPHVNKRDTKSNMRVEHIESECEKGWVESWKKVRDLYNC